jgi:hypothetical protein
LIDPSEVKDDLVQDINLSPDFILHQFEWPQVGQEQGEEGY